MIEFKFMIQQPPDKMIRTAQQKGEEYLPPGLSTVSSHTFGSITVSVSCLHSSISAYSIHFLGLEEGITLPIQQKYSAQIITTLWHFYVYLSDHGPLPITFKGPKMQPVQVKVPIQLKSTREVLCPEFIGQILAKCSYEIALPVSGSPKIAITLKTEFNQTLHRGIGSLINLKQFVVFDGISPICSETELLANSHKESSCVRKQSGQNMSLMTEEGCGGAQRNQREVQGDSQSGERSAGQIEAGLDKERTKQGSDTQKAIKRTDNDNRKDGKQNKDENKKEEKEKDEEKEDKEDEDEERRMMMEQDIDRLIREMQSKPYDFNRYQHQEQKQEQVQFTRKTTPAPSMMDQTHGNNKKHSTMKQFYIPENNCESVAVQRSLTNSANPLHCHTQPVDELRMGRPPRSNSNSKSKSKRRDQSSESRRKVKINQQLTQHSQHSQHSQLSSRCSWWGPGDFCQNCSLQIKITELLTSGLDHNSACHDGNEFMVKVFLNDEIEEYFAAQGLRDGENITFCQKLKIPAESMLELRQIRFHLLDDYGNRHGQGVFMVSRLVSTPGKKGTFMVSILPEPHGSHADLSQRTIVSSLANLSPVYFENNTPVHRTLRIEAQLIEKLQIVQLFLKVTNTTIPFTCIRYRIPFTKETIEFSPDPFQRDHINVFPHSLSAQPEKLLLEVWSGSDLAGEVEISLRQLKTINMAIINSNDSDPIYLFNSTKEIQDTFASGAVVGRMHITLCCGTVRHMQQFLQAIGEQRHSQGSKVEVDLDHRLGILVREKKQVSEISVQACEEEEEEWIRSEIPVPRQGLGNGHAQECGNGPSKGELEASRTSFQSGNQFLQIDRTHLTHLTHLTEGGSKAGQHSSLESTPSVSPSIIERQRMKTLPTLSQKVSQLLGETVHPILPYLQRLREKCKPHLLYNFIELTTLVAFLKEFGLSEFYIGCLVEDVLSFKNELVNINIFYDLCLSLQIEGEINPAMIEDGLLAKQSLKVFYQDEALAARPLFLVDSDMDFAEMRDRFSEVGLRLTLNQYRVIQGFMTDSGYTGAQGSLRLKELILAEIGQRMKVRIKQNFYEEDILAKIYGTGQESSEMSQSFYSASPSFHLQEEQVCPSLSSHRYENDENICNMPMGRVRENQNQTQKEEEQEEEEDNKNTSKNLHYSSLQQSQSQNHKKQHQKDNGSPMENNNIPQKALNLSNLIHKECIIYQSTITIDGVENVKESVECLFEKSMNSAYVRVIIEAPTFEQIKFIQGEEMKAINVEMELEDADGRVELCSEAKTIASAAFSLIKGIKSVYAMKSKDGEFCGLLHLTLS